MFFQVFGICVTSKPESIDRCPGSVDMRAVFPQDPTSKDFSWTPSIDLIFESRYEHLLDIHAQKKGVHPTYVRQVWFGASPIHGRLRLCALSLSIGGTTASAFAGALALPRLGQKHFKFNRVLNVFTAHQTVFSLYSFMIFHRHIGWICNMVYSLALGLEYSSINQFHAASSIPWGPLAPLSAPSASTPGKFQQCSCSRSPRDKGLFTMIGWLHHLAPDDLSLSAFDFHEKFRQFRNITVSMSTGPGKKSTWFWE